MKGKKKNCPVCGETMYFRPEAYSHEPKLNTATCRLCGFSQPACNLDNPDFCKKLVNRHLKEMLQTGGEGLAALAVLDKIREQFDPMTWDLLIAGLLHGDTPPATRGQRSLKPLPDSHCALLEEMLLSINNRQA